MRPVHKEVINLHSTMTRLPYLKNSMCIAQYDIPQYQHHVLIWLDCIQVPLAYLSNRALYCDVLVLIAKCVIIDVN